VQLRTFESFPQYHDRIGSFGTGWRQSRAPPVPVGRCVERSRRIFIPPDRVTIDRSRLRSKFRAVLSDTRRRAATGSFPLWGFLQQVPQQRLIVGTVGFVAANPTPPQRLADRTESVLAPIWAPARGEESRAGSIDADRPDSEARPIVRFEALATIAGLQWAGNQNLISVRRPADRPVDSVGVRKHGDGLQLFARHVEYAQLMQPRVDQPGAAGKHGRDSCPLG